MTIDKVSDNIENTCNGIYLRFSSTNNLAYCETESEKRKSELFDDHSHRKYKIGQDQIHFKYTLYGSGNHTNHTYSELYSLSPFSP